MLRLRVVVFFWSRHQQSLAIASNPYPLLDLEPPANSTLFEGTGQQPSAIQELKRRPSSPLRFWSRPQHPKRRQASRILIYTPAANHMSIDFASWPPPNAMKAAHLVQIPSPSLRRVTFRTLRPQDLINVPRLHLRKPKPTDSPSCNILPRVYEREFLLR